MIAPHLFGLRLAIAHNLISRIPTEIKKVRGGTSGHQWNA